MKKLSLLFAGAVLGVVIFLAGVICLIYLTSSNTVSIDVRNDSKAGLHNVALVLPGLPISGQPDELSLGQSFGSGLPVRTKLTFRILFGSNRQHYDILWQIRLLPFGSYYVLMTIDDRMQVSIRTSWFMGTNQSLEPTATRRACAS